MRAALLSSALAMTLLSDAVEAQTAAGVLAELRAMQDSARAAQAELDRLRELFTVNPDTFLLEHGVRVRYPRAGLDASALLAISRAIGAAHSQLERAYGSTGTSLHREDH